MNGSLTATTYELYKQKPQVKLNSTNEGNVSCYLSALLNGGTQDQATNTAESVDSDFRHFVEEGK